MLFSSITFLYYFLPILLIIYFLTPNKYKNLILLIFSLLFYFYGEPKYIIVLIFSCIINYFFGLALEKKKNKLVFILSLICNIGLLLFFKYTDFFISNVNDIFNFNIPLINIVMPIGISFYTFQTLSYIIDVYKGKVYASHNILTFSTYVTMLPQLVAGPIVRYETINEELINRKTSFAMFSLGVRRFIIGLGKKVILANTLGELCSKLTYDSVLSSIIIAISFTLQIYFDFSGYSDMAIGLGKMFGFNFLENFNYPLISSSVTDFWRRWHISLSSFFRDYVYIPLGGNRVSKLKWIRNIFIVWFLTGFWHGAAWNFIIWGLFFAIILLLEKLLYGKYLEKTKVFKYIYTFVIIIISFIIFNSNSLSEAFNGIKSILLLNNLPLVNKDAIYYLRSYIILITISFIACTPLLKNIINKIKEKFKIIAWLEPIYLIIILVVVTSFLIDSSFNPFLYFRF